MTAVTITRALLQRPPMLPVGAKKVRISDDKVSGFAVEFSGTGRATYRLRYGDGSGRLRDVRIGHFPELTPERARELALARKLGLSQDEGGKGAAGGASRPSIPTFASVVQEHYIPHIRRANIAHKESEALLRLRLMPTFGKKRMDEITPQDVAAFKATLCEAGLSASRVNAHLAVLRRVFNLAVKWEVFQGRNPAASPGMLPTQGRELFLTVEQLQTLMAALDSDEDKLGAAALKLLVFTGARRSEVLKARWEFVDIKRGRLEVPRSKSGRRRHISLSDRAVEIVERLPRKPGQALLFPSARRAEQPLSGLRSVWSRAKVAAGLPRELRIHDLRHTFASLLINKGVHLYDVGRLLGHSQLSTTARYAHLSNERRLDAVNALGRMAEPPLVD